MSPTPEPPDWLLPSWDSLPEDPDEPVGRSSGSARPAPAAPMPRVRTVSEVSRAIKERLRTDDGLRDLWVEGEVGRVTVSSAGHAYFALKDARATIQAVWFRDDRVRSAFQAQTGLSVIAHGRMDLFEPQGALQLYVDSLQPAGVGNLAVRFEELKARLAAEGLFDTARKRPLPRRPGAVAVITSPTGAVWHDVHTVLARRWPLTRLVVVACKVQGAGAEASITAAFRRLERYLDDERAAGRGDEAPSVTILARGGGSLEDLWSFNDERVVRAVVAHPLPVVTGVGHEVDVTLADFAADVRAATPSAAAELVVPDRAEVLRLVGRGAERARTAVSASVGGRRRGLEAEARALALLEPRNQLAASRERTGLLLDRATRAVGERLARDGARLEATGRRAPLVVSGRLDRARSRLAATGASLTALAPEATLARGYAIVRRGADGAIVTMPAQAPAGSGLTIQVAGGTIGATSQGEAPA